MSWDPTMGVLTVGERAVTLTCAPGDNECILRTYLHLVAEQRDVRLDRSVVLRRDDVLVLAELLDLDDVRLERQLATILRLSDPAATALRRELLRHRVTAAAVGVGLVAGLPFAGVAAADSSTSPAAPAEVGPTVKAAGEHHVTDLTPPTTTAVTVVTVEVTDAVTPVPPPIPAAAPVTVASAPTPGPGNPHEPPPPEPEPEIGWSVTYERDPDFVPPEGVEIGDAMVLERDAPPEPTEPTEPSEG